MAFVSWSVQDFGDVTSTSHVAQEICDGPDGPVHGLVIRAASQNGGRGRRGRSWSSPVGNAYQSLVIVPDFSIDSAFALAFIAANAVVNMVKIVAPDAPLQVKWPNDVLIAGGKVAGILVESGPISGQKAAWYIVGVGINVSHAPTGLGRPTSKLIDFGCTTDVREVSNTFLNAFAESYEIWRQSGFDLVRAFWLDHATPLGTKLIAGPDANRLTGNFAGLDSDGALLLETDTGIQKISTGDVSLIMDRGE